MPKKTVKLEPGEAFITLQAVLKVCDVIPSGGMAKIFLQENKVLVNDEKEGRRGRKLYKGDTIKVDSLLIEIA